MFQITKIFFCWVVGLLLISYLGSVTFTPKPNSGIGAPQPGKNFNFYKSLAQWDGGNYVHIAQNGYDEIKYYAFAPLYPLSIRLLSQATKSQITSGLIISFFSTIIFLNVYFAYLKQKLSKSVAYDSIFTFIFFPTAFFMVFVYSESLFLTFVICAIYLFEKKKYKITATLVGISSLTRFIGVFLALSFIVSLLKNKKRDKAPYFLVSFLPMIAFMLLLYIYYSDPFLFASVESSWQRFIQNPIITVYASILDILLNKNATINTIFDLTTTLSFLTLLVLGIKRIPTYLWIFSMLSILLPASTGTLISMPRYVLAALGAFPIAAILLQNHKFLKITLWIVSIALQAYFASRFITGYWVA